MTRVFYRGAHAVMLTYNVASLVSFKNLFKWLIEARSQSDADVVIVLVGN